MVPYDAYPEVGAGFEPPDPTIKALPRHEPSTIDLLEAIKNAVESAIQHDDPVYATRIVSAGAGAGEQAVYAARDFRHLFVPNVPRTVNVYAGVGRTFFLGQVTAGKSLNATIPIAVDGVFLVWQAGANNDQFTVYMTSEPLLVTIT
ncbi:MAG: hypothetical protein ACR2OE_01085 [Thermomicrobiales bacterium]